MPRVEVKDLDLIVLEETLWLLVARVGIASYDLPFEQLFASRRPLGRPETLTAVGHFGVCESYDELYHALRAAGISLLHTPEQYRLANELPLWYPYLEGLTPRSLWFEAPPTVEEIERHFDWPIFLKGSRQTSQHKAARSIVRTPAQYEHAAEHYRRSPILSQQALVCREFVPLRPVPAPASDLIPPAFEFRTWWWRGRCVGAGPYWAQRASYDWTEGEARAGLALAKEAARRLELPFVVIDIAQSATGRWLVIECNDAQESGYPGISPALLWRGIIDAKIGARKAEGYHHDS